MTKHQDSRYIAASSEQLFELIADVERYPEFLSLWRWARVYERDGDVYLTDQEVGVGPIRERFRTRTVLQRPDRIEVSSPDSLFRAFEISWTLTPLRAGCRVSIRLTWAMHSRPLQRAIDMMLPTVARAMVDAFERRALNAGKR